MPQDQLDEIIRKHGLYLNNKPGGVKADLRGADLSLANLSMADLRGADLSRADLSKADLSASNLRGADLSLAALTMADLSLADLSHTNLSWAILCRADLSEADLSGANLSFANLHNIHWRNANVDNVELRGVHPDDTMRSSNFYFVDKLDDRSAIRATQMVSTMQEAVRIAIEYAQKDNSEIDYHSVIEGAVDKIHDERCMPDVNILIDGFPDAHVWIGGPAFILLLGKAGLSLDEFTSGFDGLDRDGEWAGERVAISQSDIVLEFVSSHMDFDLENGVIYCIERTSEK